MSVERRALLKKITSWNRCKLGKLSLNDLKVIYIHTTIVRLSMEHIEIIVHYPLHWLHFVPFYSCGECYLALWHLLCKADTITGHHLQSAVSPGDEDSGQPGDLPPLRHRQAVREREGQQAVQRVPEGCLFPQDRQTDRLPVWPARTDIFRHRHTGPAGAEPQACENIIWNIIFYLDIKLFCKSNLVNPLIWINRPNQQMPYIYTYLQYTLHLFTNSW